MIIITGAAGFIGYHVAQDLLNKGHEVIGIDNLNDYYDVNLKLARLEQLKEHNDFRFEKLDISNAADMIAFTKTHPNITHIIHLAAQAGVRYSLENPYSYGQSNLMGHLTMLEMARHAPNLKHFVYASSSSVYGANTKQPFSIDDPVNEPVSLYAATKRSTELLTQSYASLYGIPSTGLRFFTVYGPWGRPDMAYFSFTRDIMNGDPITVFNDGDMERDFTWIDDCVSGIIAAMDHPPTQGDEFCIGSQPHRVFNLGNNKPEKLIDFIDAIEKATCKQADKIMAPMAAGDVKKTYADIDATTKILGYKPVTPISEGIPTFVQWYKSYYS